MAKLMYREDGKWNSIEGLEKVHSGGLVGMPDLDPDEVRDSIESATEKEEQTARSSTVSTVSPDDWKLKQSPTEYLSRTPNGPQAKLAKQFVDAGLGDITVDDVNEEEDEDED